MVGHFWIGRWDGLAWAAGLVGAGGPGARGQRRPERPGGGPLVLHGARLALALGGLVLTVAFGVTLASTHGRSIFPGGQLERRPRSLPPGAPRLDRADDPGRVGARVSDVPPGHGAGWRRRVDPARGLGLGVPTIVAGLLPGRAALVVPGALAVASALAVHGVWVARLVRHRKRPKLDWGLRFVLTGTACLVPAAALGLALAFGIAAGPRAALAYVVLGLGRLGLPDHRRHDAQDRAVPGVVPRLRAARWPPTGTHAGPAVVAGRRAPRLPA